jgi:protein required for attachment to host cells
MSNEFYNYCMSLAPNQLRNVIEAERDRLYRYRGEKREAEIQADLDAALEAARQRNINPNWEN